MRGADVARADTIPDRIIPALGQVSENSSEVPVSKESWNVLQERVAGSYFANDPGGVRPHVSGVIGASAFARGGEGLTGEAAGDDVNSAAPGPAVEGPHVIKDLEGFEVSVPLPGPDDFLPVWVVLDSADGSPSEKDGGEESTSCAGE